MKACSTGVSEELDKANAHGAHRQPFGLFKIIAEFQPRNTVGVFYIPYFQVHKSADLLAFPLSGQSSVDMKNHAL